ncbi:MAG: Mur ligase family protein [Armatimonadota bacterium]|nr:Mur ligase family protein [Armatimonadota bacterium]
MTDLRLAAAIAAGKTTAALSRFLGAGGGTTMPGRVARGLLPDVTSRLARRLARGTIVVTGTNGKTTTSRLISHILGLAGLVSVHNRAGANLAAGITAALVQQADVLGAVRADVGVFEVDEATLPLLRPHLRPRVVVLTNLFRDQLDRYGEIDIIGARWRAALEELGPQGVVVFNADDPLVTEVAAAHAGVRVPYGIEDVGCGLDTLEHTADSRYCYRCGVPYRYVVVYFGHMGVYRCPQCARARPAPAVAAEEVRIRGIEGTAFLLRTPEGEARVQTRLPGVYNIHNVLAAAACCRSLEIPPATVARGIVTFAPAFGRAERVQVGKTEAVLLLAKNPAGFNEVLRTMLRAGGRVALIAINDLTADGRDISWLWDVDFEMLAGRVDRVVVSGIRAEEMALRLKYAGVAAPAVHLEKDLAHALDTAADLADGRTLYILPTYTAMLQLRRVLQRRGAVRGFWED